ncbi:hypothetical protein, partial [Bradyrhizobium sp. CCBAU 45321]|uniref:hypothetical protein n=1 Tax=Bradyrhizobium sp. CCBAU 45321 TaxID=1641878 RepID=UPI002304577F
RPFAAATPPHRQPLFQVEPEQLLVAPLGFLPADLVPHEGVEDPAPFCGSKSGSSGRVPPSVLALRLVDLGLGVVVVLANGGAVLPDATAAA